MKHIMTQEQKEKISKSLKKYYNTHINPIIQNILLTAKIKGEDVGDKTEITKLIRIRNGQIQ